MSARELLQAAAVWCAFTCAAFCPNHAHAQCEGVLKPADFDWTMPRGFVPVYWKLNGSAVSPVTKEVSAMPEAWEVVLLGLYDEAASRRWEIQGATQVTSTDRTKRQVTATFPALGTYTVKLKVGDIECTKPVHVMDYLVVSMGDSYASGEGNPMGNATPGTDAQWAVEGDRCHRSELAGPWLAAQKLAAEVAPHSSLTFVHIACSGARLTDLYGDHEPLERAHPELPAQVDQLRQLVCSGTGTAEQCRRIDAVTISAGGNDARFASIIVDCIADLDCAAPASILNPHLVGSVFGALSSYTGSFDFKDEGHAADQFERDWLRRLSPRYDTLASLFVQPPFTGASLGAWGNSLEPARIYLTEYPDITTGPPSLPSDTLGITDSYGLCNALWIHTDSQGHLVVTTPAQVFQDPTVAMRGRAATLLADAATLKVAVDGLGRPPTPRQVNDLWALVRTTFAHMGVAAPNQPPDAAAVAAFTNTLIGDITTAASLSPHESRWVQSVRGLPNQGGLNGEVYAASQNHHYKYVGGMIASSLGHGYCAGDPATSASPNNPRWVVQAQESLINQHSPWGAFHPNFGGQVNYRDHIFDALKADLVPAQVPVVATTTPPIVVSWQAATPTCPAGGYYSMNQRQCLYLKARDPLSDFVIDRSLLRPIRP